MSDASGRYAFDGVSEGAYALEARVADIAEALYEIEKPTEFAR